MKVAFVGGGQMAAALLGGILSSGQVPRRHIHVTEVRPARQRWLRKRFHVSVSSDNLATVRWADVIVLCVKPDELTDVLREIRTGLTPNHIVVSIAAGVRTSTIEQSLAAPVPVIRVMPNLPATVGAGMAALTSGRWATSRHLQVAETLLGNVGSVVRLLERHFDAVTAVSGSGPAYVFYLAEAMQAAGRRCGLPGPVADALVRQTILGAGKLLISDHAPAERLRQRVTSPGGTTAAAFQVLEHAQVKATLMQAIERAAARSRDLSRL
ncbi:MAG: pyrroline-5-carboxylate reductase [Elusimicrobia bacterium]|nr:pyrroline-5-carboxylate reductase [Elusimicrobiota bacterium]